MKCSPTIKPVSGTILNGRKDNFVVRKRLVLLIRRAKNADGIAKIM
jgi:hypothetical protein